MAAITTTTAKKKLGKNLNKLTKPPAPPVNAESSKASAASRNGLLLLSTNKRNNSLLGYSNKSTSNTPLPSLGLQYESTASTHDVLLGAVVGAASSRADQQPDAWGVHNKDKDNQQPPMPLVEEHTPAKKETLEPAPPRSVTPPPRAAAEEAPAVPTVNWDEYGGRETTSTTRGLVSVDAPPVVITANMNKNEQEDDQQHAHMAKLARERAERRRQEEAARINEQKEKASQRLQALESKMGKGNSVLEASGGGGGSSHSNNNNNNNALAVTTRQQPTQQRTLYDPNQGRMCNSLVGGTRDRKNSGGASIASSHDEPRSPKGNATPGAYGGPVIHLNSYEDRDRGEATRPAAPRMLFDPKSGSMVAVPSRDEKPKKENAKTRGGRRGKNTKEDNDNNNGKGKKNQKSKKDSKSKGQAATKKHANPDRKFPRTRGVLYARDDKGNCYCADGCDGDLGYGAHSVPGGRVKNPKAFAKFSEQQQQLYKEQQQLQQQLLMKGREHGIGGYTNPTPSTGEYGLENGLAMPQDEHAAVLDWVKPNEKIELVTGMDDESPTLQATAREWAPSQAALAAAQNVAGLLSIGSHDMDEEEDDEDIINFEPRDNTAAAAVRALLNSNMDDDEDDDGPVSFPPQAKQIGFFCAI